MSGIGSLPTDVLVMIFSYAPVRARLRCISFVCKRWRSTALRSITTFTFPILRQTEDQPILDSRKLLRFLQLLPFLTGLEIDAICTQPTLPTTLQELSLPLEYTKWLLRAENNVLPSHFPSLRALALRTDSLSYVDTTPLSAFISRHASQLTRLEMAHSFDAAAQNVSFPALLTLKLIATRHTPYAQIIALLERAPALTHLELSLGLHSVLLPARFLTSLVSLHTDCALSPGLSFFIEGLPKLRYFVARDEIPHLSHFSPSGYLDGACTWYHVGRASNLRTLIVHARYCDTLATPTDLYLPHLETLVIGPDRRPVPSATAMGLLKLLLLCAPRLRRVVIRKCDYIEELLQIALQSSVRSLHLIDNKSLHGLEIGKEYGWVDIMAWLPID